MPIAEELVKSIDERIGDIEREVSRLEDARSALLADGSLSRAPSTRKPRAARSTPKSRGASARLPDELHQILAQSERGMTTAALAKAANAERTRVLGVMRQMESAGGVKRTGIRRGTRWHAITSEEKIQRRAAEVAGREHVQPRPARPRARTRKS